MKKSKFSEEQVVRILQEVESGKGVREVCSVHGLSEATFYKWKRKYNGTGPQGVRRVREFQGRAGLRREQQGVKRKWQSRRF